MFDRCLRDLSLASTLGLEHLLVEFGEPTDGKETRLPLLCCRCMLGCCCSPLGPTLGLGLMPGLLGADDSGLVLVLPGWPAGPDALTDVSLCRAGAYNDTKLVVVVACLRTSLQWGSTLHVDGMSACWMCTISCIGSDQMKCTLRMW